MLLIAPKEADWTDIAITSADLGKAAIGVRRKSRERWIFDGYQYASEGEFLLAKLLTEEGVPFTPDVRCTVRLPHACAERVFYPDFVLNGETWLWTAGGKPRRVHGLEAKGNPRNRPDTAGAGYPRRVVENFDLLRAQRGIVIKILSEKEIRRWAERGRLPLEPAPDDR